MFQTDDMIEQHRLLAHIAAEVDAGRICTTATEVVTPLNAENLRQVHAKIESGMAKGKIVLEGF